MEEYFANFIKTGNPNGPGMPSWPEANGGKMVQFMHIDVNPQVDTATHLDRKLYLDQVYTQTGALP
jgi:para-nitrobenzyl esterase